MTGIHVGASIAALVSGAFVAWLPKGTATHRVLGWCYGAATLAYAATALLIFPSTGRFTPFHAIAVQSIALVAVGIGFARARRRGVAAWRIWHLRFMLYSYVALVVTGLRFALPFVPDLGRLGPLTIFTIIPMCSWWWIERRVVPRWRAGSPIHRRGA